MRRSLVLERGDCKILFPRFLVINFISELEKHYKSKFCYRFKSKFAKYIIDFFILVTNNLSTQLIFVEYTMISYVNKLNKSCVTPP